MKMLIDLARSIRLKDKLAAELKREARRQVVRLSTAKALVLWGRVSCFDQDKVASLMPAKAPCPRSRTLRRYAGGMKGCISRVKEGGWDIGTGLWTPDFVHGLKLAGGLRSRDGAGNFYVPFPSKRSWMAEEFKAGLPVSCLDRGEHIVARGLVGHFVRSFYLGEMSPTDQSSPAVLAGLLAGSMKMRKVDGLWLAIKRSEESEWLLKRWGIAFKIGKSFTKWNDVFLTSPFYAAVMRFKMPAKAREWVEKIVEPAWCPLLPMAMWQMALRGTDKAWGMPFPGALPWGRGRMEASRMGCGLRGLKVEVMQECGVTGVYGPLRDEMVACYELAKKDPSSRLLL